MKSEVRKRLKYGPRSNNFANWLIRYFNIRRHRSMPSLTLCTINWVLQMSIKFLAIFHLIYLKKNEKPNIEGSRPKYLPIIHICIMCKISIYKLNKQEIEGKEWTSRQTYSRCEDLDGLVWTRSGLWVCSQGGCICSATIQIAVCDARARCR